MNHTRAPIIKALAPMDGITDYSFRRIMRDLHPDVWLYSEFTNVKKLLSSPPLRIFAPIEDSLYFVQLLGNQPQNFTKAVAYLADRGISKLDINMGCSSRRIAASQHGSALMNDVKQACSIIAACKKVAAVKITVKTRLGWDNADDLIAFVKSLTDAGLDMITIHGRTYRQKFKGLADWEPIYRLKKAVKLPVLGNGDICDLEDGLEKVKNLDGFMIGRAALQNPWIFWPKQKLAQLTPKQRLLTLEKHFAYATEHKSEQLCLTEIRKYLPGYLQAVPAADDLRLRLMQASSIDDFSAILTTAILEST